MLIQYEDKEKRHLCALLLEACSRSGMSQGRYALSVGLSKSDISNLKQGKWLDKPHLIGERKWVRIACIVGYEKREVMRWHTAPTEVFEFITAQLTDIQAFSMASILVDAPGIGKTHAAKEYVKNNPNAFYINCSLTPTKHAFMRAFCQLVGVEDVGSLHAQWEEALYTIAQLDKPVMVIDEAGDLENRSILLLKRMYNELEGRCGLYLIGSDGLRNKIQRGIRHMVQGYTEFFSRFGNKYSSIYHIEDGVDGIERRVRLRQMAMAICEANRITDKAEKQQVLSLFTGKEISDLRNVTRQIMKIHIGRTGSDG